MNGDVPEPFKQAFAERATLNQKEVAALLGLDPEVFRQHIVAGHIYYLRIGFGKKRQTRRFTLAQVMDFLRKQSRQDFPISTADLRKKSTRLTDSAFRRIREKMKKNNKPRSKS